jgi:putative colanic acid biosynthesis acetyltransferase WcaF
MLQANEQSDPFSHAPSFSLRHRLHRVAWKVAWFLLASWTPAPLRRWRIFLANAFGAHIHPSASLYSSVDIWYPPNLTMKAQSALARGVKCYSMAPITIGYRAIVSQGAFLCAGTHDIHSPTFQIQARPIEIGDHAWVCAEAFVGPGVTVAEGAVLGARGVAFKDIEEWTVHVGNPASFKGERSRTIADKTTNAALDHRSERS